MIYECFFWFSDSRLTESAFYQDLFQLPKEIMQELKYGDYIDESLWDTDEIVEQLEKDGLIDSVFSGKFFIVSKVEFYRTEKGKIKKVFDIKEVDEC